MVWAPLYNELYSLAEDLSVNTGCEEGEKKKTATIMEDPSDRLFEKQKHGRRYGRKYRYLWCFGTDRWLIVV